MARIRTIKPEFWTSEQILELSPINRLLFVGLWTFCDDGGVHVASARTLKAEVFPADDITISEVEGMVGHLKGLGLVEEYEVEGRRFWAVTGWNKHQKIEKPNFKHPKKPANTRPVDDQSTTSRRPVDDQSTTGYPRNGIGIGKEIELIEEENAKNFFQKNPDLEAQKKEAPPGSGPPPPWVPEDWQTQLKSDRANLDQWSMAQGFKPGQLEALLPKFLATKSALEDKPPDTYTDFRRNFFYWAAMPANRNEKKASNGTPRPPTAQPVGTFEPGARAIGRT